MIKEIIEDLKSLKNWFKQYWFYRRHALRLKLAIRLANMKQKAFNKQYFVVLSSQDKLISLNEDEIDRLRKKRVYSPKQMKEISKKILSEQEKVVRVLERGLFNCETDEERRRFNSDIIDIRYRDKNLIQRLSRLTVLPKHIDGLHIRRTAFYYTSYGANNKMTPQQLLEARNRYFTYAKKYMK